MWPTDISEISQFIALFVYYLITVVMFVTLVVMIIMHPKGKVEWSLTGLILSFNTILWRQLYVLATGHLIPQPYGAIFWVINLVLVGFYFWVLVEEWIFPFILSVCRFCAKYWWAVLPIAILIALSLSHFTFHWI
jgi:hypothetical protein